MTTLASMHRVKWVLLEYSPRSKRVYVRAVTDGDTPFQSSLVHEDNRQCLVRVTEGVDQVENGCAWALGELVPEMYVATRLNPPVEECAEVTDAEFGVAFEGALSDLHKKDA